MSVELKKDMDRMLQQKMDWIRKEFDDNEIRIISSQKPLPHPDKDPKKEDKKRRPWLKYVLVAIVFVAAFVAGEHFVGRNDGAEADATVESENTAAKELVTTTERVSRAGVKGTVTARDTTINGKGLLIISPENARPRLVLGTDALDDPNIILATQAADIRSDNGQIVGAFVLNGELLSKGEAKAGYCSIVNGELSLGIADASPMLEQSLTEGGYFFRQYPLVVGGQIVENKPKGESVRKALAEIGGKIYVVMSRESHTFHDFSQLLIDAGVRNAIYLVGSSSYGFYVTNEGEKILIGNAPWTNVKNVSYIVWDRE